MKEAQISCTHTGTQTPTLPHYLQSAYKKAKSERLQISASSLLTKWFQMNRTLADTELKTKNLML